MMKKGYALLTVVFVMLALAVLVVGVVMLMFISSRSSVDAYKYDRAFYIAEAGRVFASKQFYAANDWTQNMGLPVTRAFGDGCFTSSIATQTATAITLISVGVITVEGKTYQRSIRVILSKQLWAFAEDYMIAWAGGGSGSTTAQIDNNVLIGGDVQIHGNINLGLNAVISGDAYASGSIYGSTSGITGTYESASVLSTTPPRLNTSYYDNQILVAGDYNNGSQSWNSQTITGDIYIDGDLTIKNNANIDVSGAARVVVTGTVTMNNNVTIGNHLTLISSGVVNIANNATIGDYCTLFSTNGFTINNNIESGAFIAGAGTSFLTPGNFSVWNNAVIYGFIFCGGTLAFHNNTTFYGNIVANDVNSIGENSRLYMSPELVNYDSIQGLEGGSEVRLGAWEEVF